MLVITHLCLAVFSFPVVCFSFLCFLFSHSDHTKHFVVLLGLAQLVWASHWLEFWKYNFLVSPLFFCTPCLVNILTDPWSVTNLECDMGCNAGIVWHKVSQTPVSFHQVNKTDRSTVYNFWKFDFVFSSTSRAVVQVTKSCPNFNNGLLKLKKKKVTGLKLQRKVVNRFLLVWSQQTCPVIQATTLECPTHRMLFLFHLFPVNVSLG